MSKSKRGPTALFFKVSEKDKEDAVEMTEEEKNRKENGGKENKIRGSIPAGRRSENWFSDIEDQVEENRKRASENETYLVRLDYRTVWIMRLLIAVLAAVIAGGVLQTVF
jgi:hypothetical protein